MRLKLGLCVLICLSLIMLVSCKTMTEEERKAYIESRTHTYEVVSVYAYISTATNQFGGVTDESLAYCFTYVGSDNKLHQVDEFEHTEHGVYKVRIGNTNKYVVNDYYGTKTLYLTKDTLSESSKNIKNTD